MPGIRLGEVAGKGNGDYPIRILANLAENASKKYIGIKRFLISGIRIRNSGIVVHGAIATQLPPFFLARFRAASAERRRFSTVCP